MQSEKKDLKKIFLALYSNQSYWASHEYWGWLVAVGQGILGCDLVGFHIEDYCINFLDCCQRGLGCRVDRSRSVPTIGSLHGIYALSPSWLPLPLPLPLEIIAELFGAEREKPVINLTKNNLWGPPSQIYNIKSPVLRYNSDSSSIFRNLTLMPDLISLFKYLTYIGQDLRLRQHYKSFSYWLI